MIDLGREPAVMVYEPPPLTDWEKAFAFIQTFVMVAILIVSAPLWLPCVIAAGIVHWAFS
jgi:hypothetical protein